MVVLFLGVIVVTPVVDGVFPASVEATGLEAEAEERRWLEARLWDGSLARESERLLRRRSSVRQALLPSWRAVLWGALDDVGPDVVAGSDGWLFREGMDGWDREIRDDVAGVPPRAVGFLARRLRAIGIDLVVMPVPSKAMALPSMLDPSSRIPQGAFQEVLVRLRSVGVEPVDLMAVYEAHGEEQPFMRTDTHWSNAGARLAAETLARRAGLLTAASDRTTEVRSLGAEVDAGNILDWMGLNSETIREGGVERDILDGFGKLREIGALDVVNRDGGAEVRPLVGGAGSPAVLVGTSFTGAGGFFRFLGHYTERRVAVLARPGGGPTGAMEALLRQAALRDVGALPRTLIWEFQAQSMRLQPFHLMRVTNLSGYLPGVGVAPAGGEQRRRGALAPGEHVVDADGLGCRVHWSGLRHDGDGRVYLRLRGRVARDVNVRVNFDGDHPPVYTTWLASRGEVVIPVLWPDARYVSLRLFPTDGSSVPVSVSDLGLVWDVDVEAAEVVSLGAPVRAWDGWAFGGTLSADSLTDGGTLVLTAGDSATPATLTVDVMRAGQVLWERSVEGLEAGERVLLSPPALPRGEPIQLRVRGAGEPPSPSALEITVVPQLVPGR